ncbi:MAG: hypothetical protein JXQ93_13070 [Flavobacteriaceae bacterium]
MENKIIKPIQDSFHFVVNKKQVSREKALHASVLFKKVSLLAEEFVIPNKNVIDEVPKSFELNFITNAYLNDELIVKNQIQKLDQHHLILFITVLKKNKKDTICEATFGYTFKKAS